MQQIKSSSFKEIHYHVPHLCFVGASAEALGLVMPLDKQAELLSCRHVYTVCAQGMVCSLMIPALILGQNKILLLC